MKPVNPFVLSLAMVLFSTACADNKKDDAGPELFATVKNVQDAYREILSSI